MKCPKCSAETVRSTRNHDHFICHTCGRLLDARGKIIGGKGADIKLPGKDAQVLEAVLAQLRPLLPVLEGPLTRIAHYKIVRWRCKDCIAKCNVVKQEVLGTGVMVLDYPDFCSCTDEKTGIIGGDRLLLFKDGSLVHQQLTGEYDLNDMTMTIGQYEEAKTVTAIEAVERVSENEEGGRPPLRLLICQVLQLLEDAARQHPDQAQSIRKRRTRIANLLK